MTKPLIDAVACEAIESSYSKIFATIDVLRAERAALDLRRATLATDNAAFQIKLDALSRSLDHVRVLESMATRQPVIEEGAIS